MDKSAGQVAYEAYAEASDGRSLVTGQELPSWDGTRRETRDAWQAAADAVMSRPEEADEPERSDSSPDLDG